MFTKRLTLSLARRIHRYLSAEGMVYPFAALVGLMTAIFAFLLHLLLEGNLERANLLCELRDGFAWRVTVIFFLPFIGVTLSFAFQRLLCGKQFTKSLTPLIQKLDSHRGNIPFMEIFTHIISSSLSVGFGGSAGLEAPSVLTGAAIGSCFSRSFLFRGVPKSELISCGAAAAISAVFHSPIAAVLFVVEALMPEFTIRTLIPPMIASACSYAFTRHLTFWEGSFFMNKLMPWNGRELMALFFCGIFTALVGILIIRCASWLGGHLRNFQHPFLRLVAGGLALCIILFLFPMLRSQGYGSIEQLLIGDDSALTEAPYCLRFLPPGAIPVILLLGVFLLKPIASVLTIEIGDGGIFAPTMFIGAYAGYAFAKGFNLLGLGEINVCNFAALGICGVFTAVMRSPLAAIFLVAETTSHFDLVIPLMLIAAVSTIAARWMMPCSIYRKKLNKYME